MVSKNAKIVPIDGACCPNFQWRFWSSHDNVDSWKDSAMRKDAFLFINWDDKTSTLDRRWNYSYRLRNTTWTAKYSKIFLKDRWSEYLKYWLGCSAAKPDPFFWKEPNFGAKIRVESDWVGPQGRKIGPVGLDSNRVQIRVQPCNVYLINSNEPN